MSVRDKFALLRRADRVWAVASIHGETERLQRLHRELERRFTPADRLVYMGNAMGHGPDVRGAVDELLNFRRRLLARPGMFLFDIAYLRGSQEEMWQKLLQLQFAPNPREVFGWMIEHGVGATLSAYGGGIQQGFVAARAGPVAITRWTSQLRVDMQAVPGHASFLSALRRAAYTDDGALLFVHAGVDPERPLSAQSDSLWWASVNFQRLERPYGGFVRVVRGFDPRHGGIETAAFTASIDGGAGFGGVLTAACFDRRGEIVDVIES
jgi:serine/threonine protein phosphatase 1